MDCRSSGGVRLPRYRFLNKRSNALPFPESVRFRLLDSGVPEEELEIEYSRLTSCRTSGRSRGPIGDRILCYSRVNGSRYC